MGGSCCAEGFWYCCRRGRCCGATAVQCLAAGRFCRGGKAAGTGASGLRHPAPMHAQPAHPPRELSLPLTLSHCPPLHLQVACGSGLVRIYDFLRGDEPSQYPGLDLRAQRDPAGVSNAALNGSDPIACE